MTSPKYKPIPDKDHRFFLYDPLDEGLMFFATKEDRDAHAKEAIQGYLSEDRLWADSPTDIVAGEVTHIVVETNRIDRPDDDADPGAWDEWDDRGHDYDYVCDYELQELEKP